MLSPHERKTVRDAIFKILSGFGFSSMEKERSGRARVYGKRANTDWYVLDRDQECVARSYVQLKDLVLGDAKILKACRDAEIEHFETFMEESSVGRRKRSKQPETTDESIVTRTRSEKKRTST